MLCGFTGLWGSDPGRLYRLIGYTFQKVFFWDLVLRGGIELILCALVLLVMLLYRHDKTSSLSYSPPPKSSSIHRAA